MARFVRWFDDGPAGHKGGRCGRCSGVELPCLIPRSQRADLLRTEVCDEAKPHQERDVRIVHGARMTPEERSLQLVTTVRATLPAPVPPSAAVTTYQTRLGTVGFAPARLLSCRGAKQPRSRRCCPYRRAEALDATHTSGRDARQLARAVPEFKRAAALTGIIVPLLGMRRVDSAEVRALVRQRTITAWTS